MLSLAILGSAVAGTIGAGFYFRGRCVNNARRVLVSAMIVLLFAICVSAVPVFAAENSGNTENAASGLGFLGAALATGLACIGAGIAVAYVGAAALGVVGEKPAMLGTTLIYLGLAEGIAIYGVIVSLLILGRL